jgi:hypothetical protein
MRVRMRMRVCVNVCVCVGPRKGCIYTNKINDAANT